MREMNLTFANFGNRVIPIGTAGENLAMQVKIDCSAPLAEHSGAHAALTVNPPSGGEYTGETWTDGTDVYWKVQNSDLLVPGRGNVVLSIIDNLGMILETAAAIIVIQDNNESGALPKWLDDLIAKALYLDSIAEPAAAGAVAAKLLAEAAATNAAASAADAAQYTAAAIAAWLDDHPEATTTVQDGAITRAKLDADLQEKTDAVDDLKSAFDSAIDGYIDIGAWHENRYIKANGEAQTYNGWKATAYLEVGNAKKLTIEATADSSGAYNAFYDSEKAHLGDNFSFNAGVNTIDIPEGAYYYRLSMPNAVNIAIKWWLAVDVEDTSKKIDETTYALTDSGILVPGYYEIGEWTFGSYINTNVSVGSTVSTTPVEFSGYGYKIIECISGDKFSVSGTGGNAPRLWAFTDSSYKLVSKTSSTSGQQTNVMLTAPEDGYLIVNSYTGASTTYNVKKYQYVSEIVNSIDGKLDKGFYSLNDVIKNSSPGYISIGAVGDTVDYTPIYSSSHLFGVFTVAQGDVFKVTGAGGNAPRLWSFVDTDDVILSRSSADLSITDLILVAPADGKLIINTYFRNYNIRKQLANGGTAYEEAIKKSEYDYRNNGLDVLSAFSNVTCCGDSLTASVVYTHDNGDGTHQVRSAYKKYPMILGQKIGAEAESVATGGYSATDWWGAYASRIVQKENHLIIIYLGTNGGLTDTLATDAPGTDYTQYANTNTGNYCKMVAKSLEVGARVLLIKIHHGGGGDTFTTNDVIDQIAEKFSVAVVNVPELLERKYHAFPDNTGVNDLHLNDLGYAAFAEALIRNVGNLPDEMMVRLIPV